MAGVLDFFSPEEGKRRREARDQFLGNLAEGLLGPTGIPERVGLLAEFLNPVVGIDQAGSAAQTMVNPELSLWDRVGAGGRMLTETAGAAAPLAAGRVGGTADDAARAIQEALTGMSATPGAVAGRDFAMDESGMFAGVGAKTADLGMLERAKIMADDGAGREEIWSETGWFKGADDKWRFEVDDSGRTVDIPGAAKARDDAAFERAGVYEDASRIKARAAKRGISIREAIESVEKETGPVSADAKIYAQTDELYSQPRLAELAERAWPIDPYDEPFKLRDVMQHSDLQAAYPSVFNRPLKVGGEGLAQYKAAYKPDEDSFFIQKYLDRDEDFSLGHEVQHRIQEQEGFARGGNKATTVMNIIEPLQAQIDDLTERGAFKGWEKYYNGPEGFKANKSYNRAVRDYIKANPEDTLFQEVNRLSNEKNDWLEVGGEQYRRLAGEVEARNVQNRMNMTPSQRRESPPWATQDVPDDGQILVFGDRVNLRGLLE